jgi:hypothetical protein
MIVMVRRTHSSIDTLPADLRDILVRMVVDGQWPEDFETDRVGKPRYEDLAAYCVQKGHNISESAIGRWAQPFVVLAMMKHKGVIVRNIMTTLDDQTPSETQKAVVELITAQAIELAISNDLTPKQISELAKTCKDCAYVSITADKYLQDRTAARAKAADERITEIAAKKKLDPETLRIIREQVYGIVS